MKEALWISLLLLAASYWYFNRFLAVKQDPKEPPFISPRIPIVGHLIGLVMRKNDYYLDLRSRYSLPIYTLPMITSKVYVVNSVDLISAVQRLPKVLAFPPIEAKFATTICASSKEANDIIANNLNGEQGDWGYSHDLYKSMNAALAPGPGLDGMNRIMVQTIASALDRLGPQDSRNTIIGLGEWTRHEITMATTFSAYGKHNPFNNPQVENAFWDFEKGLVTIMINRFPSLIARKAYRGRERVSKAFREYFEAQHHKFGSMLVQERYATSERHGVSVEDIARYEVGNSLAVLVNTAPAVFWTLFYICSHPITLEECRREVESIVEVSKGPDRIRRTVDITKVKQSCPLLTSTFQEVLRQRTLGTQVRLVMEDTMLENKYLLKQDSTIIMPSRVIHTDPAIWGPDVSEFNHKRFAKDKKSQNTSIKPNPKAFRVFGGGTTLCPGRHFAMTEILSTVVMFILRYDLIPLDGKWTPPKTDHSNIASVVMEPDTDIRVEVVPRGEVANCDWNFKLADSAMIFEVAAEDKHE